MELVEERLELFRTHGRAPFVDLAEHPGGGIDERRRGARLVGDAHEVVQDRLGRELVDDPVARASTCEPGCDHGGVETLQRACNVDALSSGGGQASARAMTMPGLEVR